MEQQQSQFYGYHQLVWESNGKSKAQIFSLVQTAGEIMGMPVFLNPQELFEQAAIRQANSILSDTSHILYSEYVLMSSGRRYSFPLCKHIRYKHSLIPLSVKLINEQKMKDLQKHRRPQR